MGTVTPKGRVVFTPHLFEKWKSKDDDGDPKYGVCLLFDEEAQKSPLFKAMQDAMNDAAKEKFGDKLPQTFKNPFRDGEEKDFPAGSIYVNFTTKHKPGVVNTKLQNLEDDGTVYAGGYGRVEWTIYSYDKKGGKGVSFGLSNFQWVADGEAMTSRKSAQEAFADYAEDDVPDGGADDQLGF